ncbi:MAG: D-amino acid dehydrogenase [Dongiaceae bacterium]
MRIAIVGAGLLGVASAYYLAKDGHEVLVLDRQSAPARETSFANASLLTPNHSFSWAAPSAPGLLLRSLWQTDSGLRLKPHMNFQLLDWGLRFLRNCTPGRHRDNSLAKTRLCFYSMAETERVTRETGIAWQRGSDGILYLFRDRRELEHNDRSLALLREAGADIAPISWDEVVAIEPALEHVRSKFVGALLGRSDEVGDGRRFTEALAEVCKTLGVAFRLSTEIGGLEIAGDRVAALKTSTGQIKADAFVLAAGSYSPQLARHAGLHLPIYPVKGYSITAPVGDPDQAPRTGGLDEGNLVTFARLGDRVRMTSVAEVVGYDTGYRTENFSKILATGRELFRDGIDLERAEYWACLRPATPDGPPIIGPSPVRNLWLNTGHGYLGWTMCCGSARLLADQMAGRQAELDTRLYRYGRY